MRFWLVGVFLFLLGWVDLSIAADRADVASYYHYWRDTYLQPSQRVAGGKYVDYQGNQSTCSEAMGYGMLITVRGADFDPRSARADFDALNRFQLAFRSNIDSRLMAWRVEDTSSDPVDTTCATDGDLDIALALLLAADKWQEPAYLEQAKGLITAIEESLVRPDYSLRRGDWDINQHASRPSDFMPANFSVFSKVRRPEFWQKVRETQYQILRDTMGDHAVFPDFVIYQDKKWQPAPANYLESEHDGCLYYNGCRVPWRLAEAAILFDDPTARELLELFDKGIGKVPHSNFKAGYDIEGKPLNDWTDGAFTAPHLCSLLVNGRLAEFELAFQTQLKTKEKYYQDSIRLLCLMLCSAYSG
ncbi:MAG: glycosyl hydrolase family 8 [Verrucomicrobiota bacterium]